MAKHEGMLMEISRRFPELSEKDAISYANILILMTEHEDYKKELHELNNKYFAYRGNFYKAMAEHNSKTGELLMPPWLKKE